MGYSSPIRQHDSARLTSFRVVAGTPLHVLLTSQPADCGLNHTERNRFLEGLYRKHRGFLARYLSSYVHNAHDIDDIIQDIFTRLSKVENLEHCNENPRAYLMQAAINFVRDNHRRRQVRKANDHDDIEGLELHSSEASPEDSIIWKQNLDLLRKTISQLRPKCRKIFEMHRFSNYTYKEIGERTGLSPRTVENYINEALIYCRKQMMEAIS